MEKLIRKYKQTPSYINLFCKICNIGEEKMSKQKHQHLLKLDFKEKKFNF